MFPRRHPWGFSTPLWLHDHARRAPFPSRAEISRDNPDSFKPVPRKRPRKHPLQAGQLHMALRETLNLTASTVGSARHRSALHSLIVVTGGEVSPGGPGQAHPVGPEEPPHKAEGAAGRAPIPLGRRVQAGRGRQHSGPGEAAGGGGRREGEGGGPRRFGERKRGRRRRRSAKGRRRVVLCLDRGRVGRVRVRRVRRRQVHAERANDKLIS